MSVKDVGGGCKAARQGRQIARARGSAPGDSSQRGGELAAAGRLSRRLWITTDLAGSDDMTYRLSKAGTFHLLPGEAQQGWLSAVDCAV